MEGIRELSSKDFEYQKEEFRNEALELVLLFWQLIPINVCKKYYAIIPKISY